MQIAEHDKLRLRRHVLRKFLRIDSEIVLEPAWESLDLRSKVSNSTENQIVGWLLDQDFVAGSNSAANARWFAIEVPWEATTHSGATPLFFAKRSCSGWYP